MKNIYQSNILTYVTIFSCSISNSIVAVRDFPFITFSYTFYYIKSTFSKIFDIIYLSKLIYISLLDRDIMDEYIRLLHYNLSKITI